MGVRVFSASWAQKHFIHTFLTRCTSSSWKVFFSPIRAKWWVLESFRPPEPKNVWFRLSSMMYVEFIKKFFPADSRELIGVRIISASWPQKLFIDTFLTRCTSSSWKVFFSPIRANWWVLESFRPPEPKNVYSHFLDMMYVEFMKSVFSPIRANWWVLESFRPPEPKNVWFPLSRHDVGRVHEKCFLADTSELMGVRVISASGAQKRLIPTF